MSMGSFVSELVELREKLIAMGREVNHMVGEAVQALFQKDDQKAREVIKTDKSINAREVFIVDQAIMLIATNQPVAGDLRFLASSLRLATEMERIGDLGSNLARRTLGLIKLSREGMPEAQIPEILNQMANKSLEMLDMAIKAFSDRNYEMAEKILILDDDIDELNRLVKQTVLDTIYQDGHLAAWGVELINTAGHFERLGDHCTNLAEEIIYVLVGKNIRHNY